MFKIEKNVPMPVAAGRGPSVDYPFLKMEVGDSIFVPELDAKKASGQITYWKKNHDLNFSIRAATGTVMNEDGEEVTVEGVRIWLISPAAKSNRGRKRASTEAAATTNTEGSTGSKEAEGEAEAGTAEGETEVPADAVKAEKSAKGKAKPKVEESEY